MSKQLVNSETFDKLLERATVKSQFVAALPKHMDADRMIRIALTEFRKNPKIADCQPVSLLKCFIEAAQLGLEPGINGEAYLVPFGKECTLIPGYRGLMKNARRSDEITKIDAYAVYDGDEFEVSLGIDPNIIHKPKFKSTNAILYYAFCKLKNGEVQFVIRTKAQIEEHKNRYSKQANGQAWRDSFDEMALKTVIRNLCKRIPSSIELIETLAYENKTYEAEYFDSPAAEETHNNILEAENTPSSSEETVVREKFRQNVIAATQAKIDTKALYADPDTALETYDTKKLHAVNVAIEQRLAAVAKEQK